jgi:transcriptional regulator with XRE-family HTH domain
VGPLATCDLQPPAYNPASPGVDYAGMAMEEEEARLLELLAEIVARSNRSQREIERALGTAHGWLRLLFKGRTELKVRHILALGPLLGFTPGEFFREAYPDTTTSALEQVKAKAVELPPLKGRRNKLSAAMRLEVRDIVREELGKIGVPNKPSPEESDV